MDFSACSSSLTTITTDHMKMKMKMKRTVVHALLAKTNEANPPPPRRPLAATSVSVFKLDDQLLAEKVIARLNLSGCAVVSKGVFVVEGPTSSVQRFSRLMGLAQTRPNSVIWQGRARRPSFGKFSILRHCTNDFAVRKFFADHGASHYWDHVLRSKSNIC